LTLLKRDMGCCAQSFLEFQAQLAVLDPSALLPEGFANVSLPGGISVRRTPRA